MRRLAGFKYREVVRRLRKFGWVFDRPGPGSHEIWRHSATGRKVTLPYHPRDMVITEHGAELFTPQSPSLEEPFG